MKNYIIDGALMGTTYVGTKALLTLPPFNAITNPNSLTYYAMAVMYTNGKSKAFVKLVFSMIMSDQVYELLTHSKMYKDNTPLLNIYLYGCLSVASTSLYFNNGKLHPSYRKLLSNIMSPLMHEPPLKIAYTRSILKVSYRYITFKFAIRCIQYMYDRVSIKHTQHNQHNQLDELYDKTFKKPLTVLFMRNYTYLFITSLIMYIIKKYELSPLLNMFCGFVLVGFETPTQQKSLIKFTGGQFIYAMLSLRATELQTTKGIF